MGGLKNGMDQAVNDVSMSDIETVTKSNRILTTPDVTDTDSQTEAEMETGEIEIPLKPNVPQTATPKISPNVSSKIDKPEKAMSTASSTNLPPSTAGDVIPDSKANLEQKSKPVEKDVKKSAHLSEKQKKPRSVSPNAAPQVKKSKNGTTD